MEERILNYLEMSEGQREKSLKELKSIGFYPAYGKERTMKKIMDKSVAGDMPQFYFVFRKEQLMPEIGYHIRNNMQCKGYAKEAASAVRDWTFENTPFNEIYSYMKYTNVSSYKTAISWGCRQVDEYVDDENAITKVYAITREEWSRNACPRCYGDLRM